MASSKQDELTNLMRCFNCKKDYNIPRLLSCGNTVCETCILTYSEIECKTSACSQKHKIASLENYPVNNLVSSLMSIAKSQLKGSISSSSAAALAVYDNLDIEANASSQKFDFLSATLSDLFAKTKEQIELFDRNLNSSKILIDEALNRLKEQIIKRSKDLNDQLNQSNGRLLKDVLLHKNEKFCYLNEFYLDEMNLKNMSSILGEMQRKFQFLEQRYTSLIENGQKSDHKKDSNNMDNMRVLIDELEKFKTNLELNSRLLPLRKNVISGLEFASSDQKIDSTLIGQLQYLPINEENNQALLIDAFFRIKYLNMNTENYFKHDQLKFSFDGDVVVKRFNVITKNRIFLLHEKYYGHVKSTKLNIINSDGISLCKNELIDSGIFFKYAINENFLVILFRKTNFFDSPKFDLCVYDKSLKFQHLRTFSFDIAYVKIDEQSIYLVKKKKRPIIDMFNYDLEFRKSFGQRNSERKPYYIGGEIVDVHNSSMYIRSKSELMIISLNNGQLLKKIGIQELSSCIICIDYLKDRFIVYDRVNKLSLYNNKGDILIKNKLRNSNEAYDLFQYTKTGHFGLINTKTGVVLVI
jgi:hypothetical protein